MLLSLCVLAIFCNPESRSGFWEASRRADYTVCSVIGTIGIIWYYVYVSVFLDLRSTSEWQMCHHYFIVTIITITTIINPSIAALQNNLVLGTTKTPEEGIFHQTPAKADAWHSSASYSSFWHPKPWVG